MIRHRRLLLTLLELVCRDDIDIHRRAFRRLQRRRRAQRHHGADQHQDVKNRRCGKTALHGDPSVIRYLLRDQTDILVTGLLDARHDVGDHAIGRLAVTAHENALVVASGRDRLQLGGDLGHVDLRFLQEDLTVGLDRNGDGLGLGVERACLRLRQVDRHARRHHRRRDHEDDQQNEHDVDQRRHVDIGDRAASASATTTAPAAAATALASNRHCHVSYSGSVRCLLRRLTRLQLLVDLARKNGGEFVRKTFHTRRKLAGIAREFVVGDNGGNSRDQTDGGRQQRFGDTRRDDRKVGRLRTGDGLERGHDTDDRTEQTDERTGGADGRERC
ncbi:hypothetical protein RHSP_25758 [Rhizobium freirei PRF 81]|uniref:Uncharacterized protein n=1 Tax=Rhizobium freirei PRF 81 TaxID=363754 RepID=N6V8E7_9HYPH|nr:hypothetical protein RHSP_25758 [Rhizobium freirei PRF 81]